VGDRAGLNRGGAGRCALVAIIVARAVSDDGKEGKEGGRNGEGHRRTEGRRRAPQRLEIIVAGVVPLAPEIEIADVVATSSTSTSCFSDLPVSRMAALPSAGGPGGGRGSAWGYRHQGWDVDFSKEPFVLCADVRRSAPPRDAADAPQDASAHPSTSAPGRLFYMTLKQDVSSFDYPPLSDAEAVPATSWGGRMSFEIAPGPSTFFKYNEPGRPECVYDVSALLPPDYMKATPALSLLLHFAGGGFRVFVEALCDDSARGGWLPEVMCTVPLARPPHGRATAFEDATSGSEPCECYLPICFCSEVDDVSWRNVYGFNGG
jgi:hypothetical protein